MEHADGAIPIADLLEERRHLMDVAYWMLGSGGAAERVVDEAYRRWYLLSESERAHIEDPGAWLAKVVGGICLDPPVLPDGGQDSSVAKADGEVRRQQQRMLEQEVSAVLLQALDSLSPAERAAFVLNDVFGMAPGAVADIVGQSEGKCAELANRARQSLRARSSRPTTPRQHDAVTRAVRDACVGEDLVRLMSSMASDVAVFFDGGGKLRALARPVYGKERVARSLLTLLARHPRTTLRTHSVNGRTGLVVRYDKRVVTVISLDVADDLVVQVWVTLNPDKLRAWNQPVASPLRDTERE